MESSLLVVSTDIMKRNMIESQLKPIGINNDFILSIFEKIPREIFIKEDLKSIAYHDGDIEIIDGRWLLSSHKLAKFISCLEYSQNDVILEIGSGVGYSTAILESLASIVVGIEKDNKLRKYANNIMAEIGLDRAIIIEGEHNKGHKKSAPYDKIFIFGSVPSVPEILLQQLSDKGNLVCAIRDYNSASSKAVVFTKNKGIISSSILFETYVPKMPGFEEKLDFEF